MVLKFYEYAELANEIKTSNRKTIIYGAGMIGNVFMPYFIKEYGLLSSLICFVDNDVKKQGKYIDIGGTKYPILSTKVLCNISKDTIILITNSNYSPIIEMLDDISELDDNEAVVIPIIQALSANNHQKLTNIKKSSEQLIPKKIHYCWFSGNPIPDHLKQCIESWHKYCPDYEIIKWDENNYDVQKVQYMKQAYEAKKWGFVPDVARLDILYREGGIYLDTDVELIRNLDELLYQKAFVGVEKWGNVNMGGCSGAVPRHPIIEKLLKYRMNINFIEEDGSLNMTTCGYYETIPLMEMGMLPNNTIQHIQDLTVYSSDFFHPYDYMTGETCISENTFSIHHFNGGWLDKKNIGEREKTKLLFDSVLQRMNVQEREKYRVYFGNN